MWGREDVWELGNYGIMELGNEQLTIVFLLMAWLQVLSYMLPMAMTKFLFMPV